MTPNDTQMDVLMRRYAKHATERGANTEHLDADELSAFAEGSLPEAARSQYVSHLANCGDCRKLASQLAIASGSAAHAQVPVSESVEQRSWWQKLTLVLSPSALRYAAFSLVLLAVVGVAFVVWRQPRRANSDLVAKNEPNPNQTTAQAPAANTDSLTNRQPHVSEQKALAQATPGSKVDAKAPDVTSVNPPPPPAKTEVDVVVTASNPAVADRPIAQPRAESSPSYAPQPGEYRVDSRSREQQNIPGLTSGGPRRNETFEKYKTVDRVGSVDVAKARDEDRGRAAASPPKGESKQEEAERTSGSTAAAAPRRSMDDKRAATRKTDAAEREEDEEAPQTRSVGGRKFQRQGNAWVDVKFKSSMSIKNVTRASDDFASLDSGLRSIAQQLGGEVVVVWKGKAYRFR